MVRKEIGTLLVALILTLLAWLLPILFPALEAVTGYKILAGLVVVGALAATWVIWPIPEKIKEEKIMNGDDNRIQVGSIVGNQNKIGHEIHHHRPAQRHLTVELRQGVEQRITRESPVHISYPAGDHEAQTLANELHAYLAAQGYDMNDKEAGWFSGSTPAPNMVNVTTLREEDKDIWHVYLGPAA